MNNQAQATQEGPDINALHHRVTDFPKQWQDEIPPEYFYAVIHDVLFSLYPDFHESELKAFQFPYHSRDWYPTSLLLAYFLSADCFKSFTFPLESLLGLLDQTARELTQAGETNIYIHDVDRREELIRVGLDALGLRPLGESPNQAEDRLQAVSSQERMKVLKAAKAAEQRAQELRAALAAQKAKEAADKMSRE